MPSCSLMRTVTVCRLSVSTMAGNLTTQVRGCAQISAAAVDGDFARFITVEASREMDSLKTQINQMVFNLHDSIQKNTAARLPSWRTGVRVNSWRTCPTRSGMPYK